MATRATMAVVSPVPGKFSRKLAAAIDAWGGRKAALARRAGVTRQQIQKYLDGSTPKPEVIHALADALGVSLDWLLNENDDRVEPVTEDASPRLSEASPNDLIRQCSVRYEEAALVLYEAMEEEEKAEFAWSRIAMHILVPHDPEKLHDLVTRAIARVEQLDKIIFYVKSFTGCYRDFGWTSRARTLPRRTAINPEELLARVDAWKKKNPGIQAIVDYLIAKADDSIGDAMTRLNGFWSDRAPFHLARIINDPKIADHPQLSEIRQMLREGNYLKGPDDTPADFPSFQLFADFDVTKSASSPRPARGTKPGKDGTDAE